MPSNKKVVKLVIQDDYAYKYTLIWQAVFLLFLHRPNKSLSLAVFISIVPVTTPILQPFLTLQYDLGNSNKLY